MPAAIHNFIIEQGSNFFITFQYLDENSNPIDITKYCIKLAVKTNTDQVGLYSSQAPNKPYVLRSVSSVPGTIEWGLSYQETRKFNFDTALYDLYLNDPNNENIRICTGTITLLKNNFPECVDDTTSANCVSCGSISAANSLGNIAPTSTIPDTTSTPDTTPVVTPTIPANLQQEELCDYLCKGIDLFGKLYNYADNIVYQSGVSSGTIITTNGQTVFESVQYVPGTLSLYLSGPGGLDQTGILPSQFTATDGETIVLSNVNVLDNDELTWINKGLVIQDLNSVTGTMYIADTGTLTNVEVTISNLKHKSPQDLSMILVPPEGDPILLSSFNKIKNYSYTSGLNFTFSNKAIPNVYLNNRSTTDLYINILDKTLDFNNDEFFPGTTLQTDLSLLNDISPSGDWSLIVRDHDLLDAGTIDGWNLILTYKPNIYIE
jgi:subtilisin-like proprotein convertase family protein